MTGYVLYVRCYRVDRIVDFYSISAASRNVFTMVVGPTGVVKERLVSVERVAGHH